MGPLLILPPVLPSTYLAVEAFFHLGIYGTKGAFSRDGNPIPAPFLTIPTLLWLWGWLFHWEREHDVIQMRISVGLVAGFLSLVLCALLYYAAVFADVDLAYG